MGSFELDRAFWGRPELMNMSRPVALINAVGSPGTDLLASTAAALAAAGMALADDAVYSTRLIVTAQQLYGCDISNQEREALQLTRRRGQLRRSNSRTASKTWRLLRRTHRPTFRSSWPACD